MPTRALALAQIRAFAKITLKMPLKAAFKTVLKTISKTMQAAAATGLIEQPQLKKVTGAMPPMSPVW